MPSSPTSSPRKFLSKKPSLSILSGSNINELNNVRNNFPEKPIKERVVSESTGLIKLSLDRKYRFNHINTQKENIPQPQHKGLPIYIPVRKSSEGTSNTYNNKEIPRTHNKAENSEERIAEQPDKTLLFRLASKQRTVLDLKEKLQATEKELQDLEIQYKKCLNPKPNPDTDVSSNHNPAKNASIMQFTANIGKKASKLNFKMKDINQSASKQGPNLLEGLNKISENMSKNDFFRKGKTILSNMNRENEKWINQRKEDLVKKFQDSSFLNQTGILDTVRGQKDDRQPKTKISQIFGAVLDGANRLNKDKVSNFSDDDDILDEIPDYLDYAIPSGLKREDNNAFQNKIKGTIICNDSTTGKRTTRPRRRRHLCEFPSDSEEDEEDEDDYGGEVRRYIV